MRRERKVITIILAYFIIFTAVFGILFCIYWMGSFDNYDYGGFEPTPIKYVDEEKRSSRPYTYITPISQSNITSVEDLYIPKSFDNDNITVYFPEGDSYSYRIAVGPDPSSGGLIISHINGSELDHITWGWGVGSYGGGGFEGGESLILSFSGQGRIIFVSGWTYDWYDGVNYTGTVESGILAFYLPWELIVYAPDNRRIVAQAHSDNETYFHIRYYDGDLHFLAEAKGTQGSRIQIPAGDSPLILAVVESNDNVTIQFSYSEPIPPQLNLWGYILLGGFILSLTSVVVIVILYRRTLWSRGFLSPPFKQIYKK